MNVQTAVAIVIAVFFGTLTISELSKDRKEVDLAALATKNMCVSQGYTHERMDLIPYSRCHCNNKNECFCYPI